MRGRTFKHSKKRDVILALLRSTKEHPTAGWVYSRLKESIPGISLGTVYRNITVLRRQGLVMPVTVVNGEEHFDALAEPHPHIVCLRCGAVSDISPENAAALESCVASSGIGALGIDFKRTLFYGRCPRCAPESPVTPEPQTAPAGG
ncbi:MAG: transcriptional repressor [Spirochaetaceae bacterium]|nr:transcriptional repressor [Spirochaetaceae bacterium]